MKLIKSNKFDRNSSLNSELKVKILKKSHLKRQ